MPHPSCEAGEAWAAHVMCVRGLYYAAASRGRKFYPYMRLCPRGVGKGHFLTVCGTSGVVWQDYLKLWHEIWDSASIFRQRLALSSVRFVGWL